MTRLTIEVTQSHVERGLEKSCKLCPVALAIADHPLVFDGSASVDNYSATFHLKGDVEETWTRLPNNVRQWIRHFDRVGSNVPITFTLEFD